MFDWKGKLSILLEQTADISNGITVDRYQRCIQLFHSKLIANIPNGADVWARDLIVNELFAE